MKIKDPLLRSCYSHHLLSNIEEDIDDYRDNNGYEITVECFATIVAKYQHQVPHEADLLYDLAFENFLEGDGVEGENHEFEGCGNCEFPEYRKVLENVGKHSDEMWEAYDLVVHNYCIELCDNITNKDNVVKIATEVAKYQLSFDEENSVFLHTIFFVLKTLVPSRTNSKYQNSVKRAEIWIQEALLM